MKRNLLVVFISALSALCSLVSFAAIQPSNYKLDLDGSVGPKLTLNLPDDGAIVLTLIRATASEPQASARLALVLTPFHSESNGLIDAKLVEPADPSSIDSSLTALRARIALPPNLPPGKYEGGLVLSSPNTEPMIWKIELVRPPLPAPVSVVAGQQTVTIDLTRRMFGTKRWIFWGPERTAVYNIPLRWKNGTRLISDIVCLQDQPPKAPDGKPDPKLGLDVKIVQDTGTTDAKAVVTVKDLSPGEYVYYLRFTVPGSPPEDQQKVTVTVRVRHPVGWAIVTIFFGLLLSFISTKYVNFLRARAQLTEQIVALERCWGAGAHSTLPPCLAVAWSRSVLDQVREQARFRLFTQMEILKARLDAVERVVKLLDKIESLVVGAKSLPYLQGYRAQEEIADVLKRIDPNSLSDATEAQIMKEVEELRGWIDPSKCGEKYWNVVRDSYNSLVTDINLSGPGIDDPSLQRLIGHCPNGDPNAARPDPDAIRRYDEDYCRLRIIWDYRHWKTVFNELSGFEQRIPRPSLDEFFEFADNLAWGRLKQECDAGKAEVENTLLGGAGTAEAYRPILFTFSTYDSILNKVYVVKHGCTYRWSLRRTYSKRQHWFVGRRRIHTTPDDKYETSTPMLVTYPVGAGHLTGQVEICRKGESANPILFDVGDVLQFEGLKAFMLRGAADNLSFLVTLLLAMIGGLAAYYYNNAVFGSVKDYLSLLLIAAGIDQSKNALQLIQGWKPGSAENSALSSPPPQGLTTSH